ncbi:DUF4192 domain-containing protein [Solicola sp. PLA-1-18]|uniref:DUF4192 domain-containing protein n=1 Tax=Solicola sp. PLA-1-18 TaxID=3380532 RepID=UPI003B7BB5CB
MLLTVKNPADLVAALCTALGFVPTESVIVHLDWADDPTHKPPMFRMDLDAIEHVPATVEDLAARHGQVAVSVVVIGADLAAGHTATAASVFALEAALHDLVAVQIVAGTDGRHVWCACDTDGCADTRWTVDLDSHRFVTEAAAAGQQVRPASSIDADLTPGTGTTWPLVDAQAVSDSIDFTTGDDPRAWINRAVKMAAREVPAQTRTDVAHLVAASQVIPIRDLMWAHITRANAADALALWAWVARNTVPERAVNALALAGFAAWQTGNGYAARVALANAGTIDPTHSMTILLDTALVAQIDPRTWEQPPVADLQEAVDALWRT